jgi:hypothetical protein
MSDEKNIYQRINEAGKALLGRIPKDGWNGEQKYKFTSHDGAVEFVRPSLMDAGIVFAMTCKDSAVVCHERQTQYGMKYLYEASAMFECAMINIDKPDDRHTFVVPAHALDYSDKALGKAISYAKKYALLAMCGLLLATGEEYEADKTSPGNETPPPQKPKAPPQKKESDSVKEIAKRAAWNAAKKAGIVSVNADKPKLQEYAITNGINVPLDDMTAAELNELEGKIVTEFETKKD